MEWMRDENGEFLTSETLSQNVRITSEKRLNFQELAGIDRYAGNGNWEPRKYTWREKLSQRWHSLRWDIGRLGALWMQAWGFEPSSYCDCELEDWY